MESTWFARAKRLLALAETGLQFTHDPFDAERYEEMANIAIAMLAEMSQAPVESLETVLRTGESGYVTPKVEVRGAVFKDNKILLVQEKEDDLWSLPGGYADVGLSAAENVEKEIWEEANIQVKAKYLYALRHKAKGAYPADPRDFYKLHFICDGVGEQLPSAGLETQNAAYFAQDQLPPLSPGKVLIEDLHAAWHFVANPRQQPSFD